MADFATRERHRQATFRRESPTVSAEGRSPTDDAGRKHGHLLALGCEEENLYPPLRGKQGARRFFQDRRIKWWRSPQSGDPSGGSGPTRNLLSSQLACVNFMLPLADSPTALAAALSGIDEDIEGIAPIEDPLPGTSSPVEIEWIGLEHALEGPGQRTRGANNTSIDAFVIAETSVGRRAYLLEWKYAEKYAGEYLGDGPRGETRRERYGGMYAKSSFFTGRVPVTAWLYEPFYQIMRQRLLAERMVRNSELGVSMAKVAIVVPEGNRAYRERITSPNLKAAFKSARTVEEAVRAAIAQPPDEAFAVVSPSVMAAAVRRRCGDAASQWSDYIRDRYGW